MGPQLAQTGQIKRKSDLSLMIGQPVRPLKKETSSYCRYAKNTSAPGHMLDVLPEGS
jgi:hypothetical protein